ncbi:hypothetical protein BLNAU_13531 [Blattamonas nauphoetae]|uniref:Uncharacterized protein n=1 Tax=Blattamonas nauphoetae TaxID=2049346 RepID=A0ABQ9XJ55_9EUKA|nr:hypothetical protein BLNAU_13531 [Blattamonas nauphoetae]
MLDQHYNDGVSVHRLSWSIDNSAFMKWNGNQVASTSVNSAIFGSLVSLIKDGFPFNDRLEEKAASFLDSITNPVFFRSEYSILGIDPSFSPESLIAFVTSITVLLSSSNQTIMKASMKLLDNQFVLCSSNGRLALLRAGIIPQIINTLNPLSLSIPEAVYVHTYLIQIIANAFWLSTPTGLSNHKTEDKIERQAVHETVLQHVIAPSEKYIGHLCRNRHSITDEGMGRGLMLILTRILQISPYNQSTIGVVLNLPLFLTIPSWLTVLENESLISSFLHAMVNIQQEWNRTSGEVRQRWKKVDRLLRKEGIEDVIEDKLRNNQQDFVGGVLVEYSLDWNDLLGMNLPQRL